MTEAQPLEPIGLQGAPLDTLEAFQAALKTIDAKRATVTLIADWQDRRDTARYAVLVRDHAKAALSEDAFGPRYGQAGARALSGLVKTLVDRGAQNFKESVLAPHEFARLLEYPDEKAMLHITANANPSDPTIYLERSAK